MNVVKQMQDNEQMIMWRVANSEANKEPNFLRSE